MSADESTAPAPAGEIDTYIAHLMQETGTTTSVWFKIEPSSPPTLTTYSTKYLSREEHGGKDGKKVSGWQQQVKDRSEGTVVEFNHSHPHHSPLAL
ncbi:hypothetical protein FOXYS1_6787 [Fusarium oxysporum]|uniref:Uncharacterized protein n=1 Tax=Fusarium oxysporum TaxID=5507 RepID=A0A8H5ABW5_FUSOX|nr:hypothetical protein FOXYS1_6787 [Fusarium oxysporum]